VRIMAFFEMVKTALRTVMQKPVTILYPLQAAKKTPISRGHVVFDGSTCISCGICLRRCPSQAIVLNKEAKSWQINRFRCVVCNSCVDTCPTKSLTMDTRYTAPAAVQGVETFTITYVKPARPEKKDESG